MKLELTEQEVQIIVNVLGQGRWIEVHQLINKIATQIKQERQPHESLESE